MFPYVLPSGISIVETKPEHAARLEALQDIVFPTLAVDERFQEAHYHKHLELFAAGQFCAVDGEHVVGMTSTVRLDFDFDHAARHTFDDVIQGGWMTSHVADGDWLYGADIGVHPEYRRRGIARGLYAARQARVRELGLRGQVTVGMMSGYGNRKHEMSADAYFEGLRAGRVVDPTLSAQMRIGFEPRQLIADYLHDPVCDNYGVLIVLSADVEVSFVV